MPYNGRLITLFACSLFVGLLCVCYRHVFQRFALCQQISQQAKRIARVDCGQTQTQTKTKTQ